MLNPAFVHQNDYVMPQDVVFEWLGQAGNS